MCARSASPRHLRTRSHLSRITKWRSFPRHSSKPTMILRVSRHSRLNFMRTMGAFKFLESKLLLRQLNEASILAGCRRLHHLPGGLSRRLVTWRHRAGCRRVLIRSRGYSSEKRTARFFKRIFRNSIGLFHLGLLISSSFVFRSASSPALQLLLNSDRGGLAPRSQDQIVSYSVQQPSVTPERRDPEEIRVAVSLPKVPYFSMSCGRWIFCFSSLPSQSVLAFALHKG
jgi:hypothetical protein